MVFGILCLCLWILGALESEILLLRGDREAAQATYVEDELFLMSLGKVLAYRGLLRSLSEFLGIGKSYIVSTLGLCGWVD